MIGLNCLATAEADMVIFTIYSQFSFAWCFPINILSSSSLRFYKVIWDLLNDDDSLDFFLFFLFLVAWAIEKNLLRS